MKIVDYYKEVQAEMQYVKWPTTKMVIVSTFAIILLSVIVALYLSGVDLLLQKLLTLITKK